MTTYAYDPDNWLVSTMRVIPAYVLDSLSAIDEIGSDLAVEMSFPDTSRWTKTTPLNDILVHFELDDDQPIKIGFGIPGVGVLDDEDNPSTVLFSEASKYRLNFDVGIWVSAEMGGATKRMQVRQALKNLLHPAGARQAFNAATEGLNIVSFEGGSDALDRINDVPIWRTMTMTLIVEVFGRYTPTFPDYVPVVVTQVQELTIISENGSPEPVTD